MLRKTALLLVAAILAAIFSCNITDTDPADTGIEAVYSADDILAGKGGGNAHKGKFYPLALGNTWHYTGERMMQVGDSDPFYGSVSEERKIREMEQLFGREYFVEEQTGVISDGVSPDDAYIYWIRYRQDKAGLYEADVAITIPPGGYDSTSVTGAWEKIWQKASAGLDRETVDRLRIAHFRKLDLVDEVLGRRLGRHMLAGPPGGILTNEIQRLKYPLHVGQEWTIREIPLFTSEVLKHDVLDLPAGKMNGWKITNHSGIFGENDVVWFWYGRTGFLGMVVHLETEVTLVDGTVVPVVSDETLWLDSYDIGGKGNQMEPAEGKKAESKKDGFTL
jgi:hypothetical protein